MKKKLIVVLVFLIAMVGVMYLMGVFDKAQATAAEIEEGKKGGDELLDKEKSIYDNMDVPDFGEDTDSTDKDKFDPESML